MAKEICREKERMPGLKHYFTISRQPPKKEKEKKGKREFNRLKMNFVTKEEIELAEYILAMEGEKKINETSFFSSPHSLSRSPFRFLSLILSQVIEDGCRQLHKYVCTCMQTCRYYSHSLTRMFHLVRT